MEIIAEEIIWFILDIGIENIVLLIITPLGTFLRRICVV